MQRDKTSELMPAQADHCSNEWYLGSMRNGLPSTEEEGLKVSCSCSHECRLVVIHPELEQD